MLPYRDSRITIVALIAFFVIVVGYAYFEARGLLFGPRINTPSSIVQSDQKFILIQGTADRITSLSMNGQDIEVTEDGAFSEPYILSPGLNRITLDAKDKYGRTRHEVLQVVYTPTSTPAIPSDASSTAASSTPQP